MKAKAVTNQSILDVAIQLYGSVGALRKVLDDNITGNFELGGAVTPKTELVYDIEDDAVNKRVLRRLNNRYVMTYRSKTDATNIAITTEEGFDFITEDGKTIVTE